MAEQVTPKRCAIYVRKSTEQGLDQEYNSLDAQRDAALAYIKSQSANGWRFEKEYRDGGFSGGNTNRPALKEMIQDVRDKKIDIVVVYKIDRLSRSLGDFSRIHSILEQNEVGFISVTQQLDTSNATGRMVMNILASFSQFEREMIRDRIRDKIRASLRLGMFMGGILICPDLVALAQAGEVASVSVMGIPAPVANYGQTVLPIVLCMPVLAQVEKLMKKIVPDMLSTVFVPFLTMLVMVPVAYCALAPLGGWLGQGVGTALFAFGEFGGFIAVAVIGALWSFLVMTGMHQVLIVLAITQLLSSPAGDPCVTVGGMIAQWATWGIAFGAFLRLKNKEEKMAQLGYALSGIIGGVTEPEIYGTGFKYTRTLAGMVGGGFIGGALAGIFGVHNYMLAATNVLCVMGFASPDNPNSLLLGTLSAVVAFVASAAIVFFFGFSKEQLEEDRAAAEAAKAA